APAPGPLGEAQGAERSDQRWSGRRAQRSTVARRLLLFLYGGGARAVLADDEGHPLAAIGARVREPATATRQPAPATPPPPPAADRGARFPAERPSAAIAAHYAAAQAGAETEAARAAALATVRRAVDRLARRDEALAADLARIDGAATRRRHADLL